MGSVDKDDFIIFIDLSIAQIVRWIPVHVYPSWREPELMLTPCLVWPLQCLNQQNECRTKDKYKEN